MATKPTHTPGPRIHLGCRGDCKEYPMEDWCPGCLERYTAWQRLIAAAPDLLAALRDAEEKLAAYVEEDGLPEMCAMAESLETARAAIKKAEEKR